MISAVKILVERFPSSSMQAKIRSTIRSPGSCSSPVKVGVSVDLDVPDEDITVSADKDRLQQVLHNLLNNAIVFSGEKKQIVVRAIQVAEFAEITISDKSRKIPPELFELAFERRSSSLTKEIRQYFGKGLALPLSKLIIESMGGQIGVRAVEDQGIAFWVKLALIQQPAMVPVSELE